jgi:dTDP-glucose pyrophosphorylase
MPNMIIKDEQLLTGIENLLAALKKMDQSGNKLLIVLDNGYFEGLLSAGDIQRAIIQNISLDTNVKTILRRNVRYAKPEDSFESIRQMMLEYRMELCPVIDSNKKIVKVYYWEDLFENSKVKPKNQIEVPVIIMAGGFGTRLKPLTNVLPKPLIPFRDKTIIEEIFERFAANGCSEFIISLNYKSDLIEYYVNSQKLPYHISYFKESKPLGTAGSLALLKNKITRTFFVSNCDILIEQDYSEILKYHYECNNEITIVAAIKNYSIPYGTIESAENGKLISLSEKPELIFKINSGMYVLEPHLLNEIPQDTFFHITELIDKLRLNSRSVGVFPVSEGSWQDFGDPSYLKMLIEK